MHLKISNIFFGSTQNSLLDYNGSKELLNSMFLRFLIFPKKKITVLFCYFNITFVYIVNYLTNIALEGLMKFFI